ncbi:uncharacterized protein LOC134748954 [Cydia strobilella]|uniref:uncharacterized protein LOC134748954 n=1 Tax=Cydia strobilella TaxID=1100964 RepID=UPI00300756EC
MNQSETEDIKDLIKNLVATSKIPIKESVSTIREGTIQIPSTYFTTEHFNEFNVKLMREIEEIKKLINEFIATSKVWNEDAKEISTTEETGLALPICSELKRITRTNQSDVREIKELIKDVATKLRVNVEEAVSGKQKTVQISPTYFSPDQISKLNSELKRVAEIYQGTGMFPVIEVVPGAADEHPVMKQLRQGVRYKPRDSCDQDQIVKLKLGLGGFKRFDVIDMITEYPDLTLVEVIREWWSPRKDRSRTWQEAYKLYNFSAPLTRDKDGNLVPLESFK